MSPSIAKREKLFGPVQLVLIGVLFAVAFFYLLPRQEAFKIGDNTSQDSSDTAIGELDLAYLKARNASGDQSVQETSRAIVALVRTGQLDAAQELLDQQPQASIGAQQRFALDLELARVEYFAAEDEKQRQFRELELLNRIELLVNDPSIRTQTSLTQSVELTEQLGKPQTSVKLYKLLAIHDSDNASDWYGKCATTYAMYSQQAESAECFSLAIDSATSSDAVFELKLAQLANYSNNANGAEQDRLLNELKAHQPMSVSQRTSLAQKMLENGRADLAYLQYEQLASQDKENQKAHLLTAAKWAEGSNASSAAASYFDQAASLSSGVEKIELLEQAERLLVASGDSEQAFTRLAKRIQDDPNNTELLEEGIVRARQLGKASIAAKWNLLLVETDPTNVKAVNTQIDLALANRDLKDAEKWSRLAVALSPSSRETRVKNAQIAEWNGNPIAAMKEWQWLAEKYPDSESYGQVVRLAELNRESGIGAKALYKLVLLNPTDDENISRLVKLYELQGTPVAAATMLHDLQQANGMRAYTQREQARLYQKHSLHPEALAAWTIYADSFGRSSEETLNRMELLWRLNQPKEAADVAKALIGTSHISEATNDQVKLISELSWRYKMPELAKLVKPRLKDMDDKYQAVLLSQRLVKSLEDSGQDEEAVKEATRLWQSTGEKNLAFTAMNLAVKTGNIDGVSTLLENTEQTAELRDEPDYWILAASIQQKSGNANDAIASRQKALALDPQNVSALSGLLWAYIDGGNTKEIFEFITTHKQLAETEPQLWSAFAIAHLHLGLPDQSLTWFDRQLDRIESDYSMLLTYADALEYAGQAEKARKVRLYTIKRLRPILTEGAEEDESDLIRQYAQLLNQYGSAEDKERLVQRLLNDPSTSTLSSKFWREDIAIGWLMATERHEYARLVMAKLHEQRLEAPAWQELALAMASNNVGQIQSVINGTGNVSIGNHILALRQVGQDLEAYKLASDAINSAPTLSDREIARSQFGAMRSERPSYTAGRVKQTSLPGLGIDETGFTIRHTFGRLNVGFSLDYTEQSYSSERFSLDDSKEHSDLALTFYHGDRKFGGLVTAGYRSIGSDELGYAKTSHHLRSRDGDKTLTAELAYNENNKDSAVLRIGAIQHRVSLGYEQNVGVREYFKLQADMRDISTRVQQNRIARGLAARVEVGIRGSIGSNVWSTNVAAARSQNDVVSELPDDLALSRYTSVDSLLSDRSTSLAVGASISRGGVAGDYPQVSSPRYYLNANIGQIWPESTINTQIDGGAGMRILGGDELSIGFSHDAQPFSGPEINNDTTSFGINYQYHF